MGDKELNVNDTRYYVNLSNSKSKMIDTFFFQIIIY